MSDIAIYDNNSVRLWVSAWARKKNPESKRELKGRKKGPHANEAVMCAASLIVNVGLETAVGE